MGATNDVRSPTVENGLARYENGASGNGAPADGNVHPPAGMPAQAETGSAGGFCVGRMRSPAACRETMRLMT